MANSGVGCPADGPTTDSERIACILLNVEALTQKQLPDTLVPQMDDTWPGQTVCVSCFWMRGLIVAAVEVALLWFLYTKFLSLASPSSPSPNPLPSNSTLSKPSGPARGAMAKLLEYPLAAFSLFGWLYWFCLFSFWWNFISFIMLIGPIVVAPTFIELCSAHRATAKSLRKGRAVASSLQLPSLSRALLATGLVFGALTLATFSDVSEMPSQLVRHMRLPEYTFTPNAPEVQSLKVRFYGKLPKDDFEALPFKQQMEAVDKFIYEEVQWRSDMAQWGMVGLITTPTEVLTRPGGPAGDCQGQAATTASLLQALGFSAWQVETPFHWWTHARSRYGEQYNLNSHGNAMGYGSVLPQPIDLVYTSWPAQCSDCPEYEAHNKEQILYQAPPHLAFGLAFVGSGH
ncbi:MAG: hypothetical protein Q8P67_15440, partial [archaeon]|nr:hypothetical protein [archaeon]